MAREGKKMSSKDSVKIGDKVKADDMVTVQVTGGSHIKKSGDDEAPREKKMHHVMAERLQKKGAVTILTSLVLLMAFLFAGSIESKAQAITGNPKLVSLVGSFGTPADTVVNGATAWLQTSEIKTNYKNVTIQVIATEISGTTAGTITLFGSLDGVNWIAATDATSVPTITTKTATDVATQTFFWSYTNGSPWAYYRVSWAGTGTMSDRFTAKLLAH